MLSIVIPTYNSSHTIERCLNSILPIKTLSYEIIVVDDGSIDKTPQIVHNYAKRYNNIHLFKLNHGGVSRARNKGVNESIGKWICFIDSDDVINSKKLELIFFKYFNSKYSYSFDLLSSNVILNGRQFKNNSIYDVKTFLKKNYPLYSNGYIHVIWNKIYNNSIIKRFNIKFPKDVSVGEDLIFNLRYLMHINTVLQTSVIYYTQIVGSNTASCGIEHHPIFNKSGILKSLTQIYLKYHLSFKAINYLRVKSAYSVLLNTLKYKFGNQKEYKILGQKKNIIIKYGWIPNENYKYKRLESYLLQFLFLQPSIKLLYISLKLISYV